MIIEAGYDLFQLFAPKLFRKSDKTRQGMWVIAMDQNLRQLYLRKVKGDPSIPPEERIPEVAAALSRKRLGKVAYYAFARLDTELVGDFGEIFGQQDEALRLAPELIDHELIGTYFSNGKGVYSSGPRYSFRDYVGLEHLPRVAILPGPHEYPCDCLACTQHEEMLRVNRERRERIDTESQDS